jgi:hypothetical protein
MARHGLDYLAGTLGLERFAALLPAFALSLDLFRQNRFPNCKSEIRANSRHSKQLQVRRITPYTLFYAPAIIVRQVD